jgi:cell wall-associated NlpC family hydrolase
MIYIRDLIGKPYKRRGRGPESYDCYGLAIEVCKRFGKILEDSFYDELSAETENRLIDDKKSSLNAIRTEHPFPGSIIEILVSGIPRHIGVYLESGKFIHVTKIGVHVSDVSAWKSKIEGYYTWQ